VHLTAEPPVCGNNGRCRCVPELAEIAGATLVPNGVAGGATPVIHDLATQVHHGFHGSKGRRFEGRYNSSARRSFVVAPVKTRFKSAAQRTPLHDDDERRVIERTDDDAPCARPRARNHDGVPDD
jgi:hypothetical protein